MNDNREITISKEEYDSLKDCQAKLTLYQKTLLHTAEYSEWRKSGVTFDEEKIFDLLRVFDYEITSLIENECKKQKAEKEKTKEAEKPSFPEIKKED